MNNCNPTCYDTNRHADVYRRGTGCSCAEKSDTDCACPKSRFPSQTSYAMAYVPFQQSAEVYSCEKALSRGTIFPCLDLPFIKGCCK